MTNDSLDNSPTEIGEEYQQSSASPSRKIRIKMPGTKPYVVYTLMIAAVLVFLLQQTSILLFNGTDLPAFFGMKVNEFIIDGEFWRLITPMFLHGSILHLAFNMYALYALGPGLELHYGHGRFVALLFLAGFAGNVLSFLFTDSPSLGSSTAIFGLLGAEGVFLYKNRKLFGEVSQRALINLFVVAGINLMIGLNPATNIDNWGHLGGLLGGAIFAWFAGPVLRVDGIFPNNTIADSRDSGDAWRAGLSVFALFILVVVAAMYFNIR